MRTLTSILVATVVGLSSTAFAAEPTARETRMNEALKNYEAQKAGTPAQAKAAAVTKKQHATKKVAAKKHAVKKQQARAGKAKAATVKANTVTPK